MGVVDLTEKTSTLSKSGSQIAGATNWLKDLLQLIDSGKSIIDSINGLVTTFKGNQAGSQVITSNPDAKIIKNIQAEQKNKQGSTEQPSAVAQPKAQDLQAYFSTPEGIKTIISSIDKFAHLLEKGIDTPLREVKDLLNTAVDFNTEKKDKKPGKKAKK